MGRFENRIFSPVIAQQRSYASVTCEADRQPRPMGEETSGHSMQLSGLWSLSRKRLPLL
jgi:hypothetical protein